MSHHLFSVSVCFSFFSLFFSFFPFLFVCFSFCFLGQHSTFPNGPKLKLAELEKWAEVDRVVLVSLRYDEEKLKYGFLVRLASEVLPIFHPKAPAVGNTSSSSNGGALGGNTTRDGEEDSRPRFKYVTFYCYTTTMLQQVINSRTMSSVTERWLRQNPARKHLGTPLTQ